MNTFQPSGPPTTSTHVDDIEDSLHALPSWFAWFQKTFGLSFLVIASAYLLGNLATLGWVPDISHPESWGWFKGAGVILFFVGGVAVAGIGLTCSVVFVAAVKRRQWFMVFVTGLGMLVFFGVEVWASLSERSVNILPTPADRAVLSALGFHGVPPISPTAVVVSVLFPLGSLYFGFVQQRRVAVTQRDIEEDALEMERKVRLAQQEARLAEALAQKRAVQARGAVGVMRAATSAFRSPDFERTSAFPNLTRTGPSASDASQFARDSLSDPHEVTGVPRLDEFDPVEVYVPRDRVSPRELLAATNHNGHARHLAQSDGDDDGDIGEAERESDDDLPF